MTLVVVAAVLAALAGALLVRRASASRRRERARRVAEELLPEIRSILASADPHGRTEGRPAEAVAYPRRAGELASALAPEVRFAVDLFYRAVVAYDEARVAATAAFRDDSGLSLGDRIRAKDRRDRCLKDVYLTGEAASQKLEAVR